MFRELQVFQSYMSRNSDFAPILIRQGLLYLRSKGSESNTRPGIRIELRDTLDREAIVSECDLRTRRKETFGTLLVFQSTSATYNHYKILASLRT